MTRHIAKQHEWQAIPSLAFHQNKESEISLKYYFGEKCTEFIKYFIKIAFEIKET